jgi:hypothetical protein
MKASGIEQKLIQHMERLAHSTKLNGWTPMNVPDIAYEAGRRIGVNQGMDMMLKAAIEFFTDAEAKDTEL